MRKSVRVSAPLFVITAFYAACLGLYFLLIDILPGLARYLPVGGIQDMVARFRAEEELYRREEAALNSRIFQDEDLLMCQGSSG